MHWLGRYYPNSQVESGMWVVREQNTIHMFKSCFTLVYSQHIVQGMLIECFHCQKWSNKIHRNKPIFSFVDMNFLKSKDDGKSLFLLLPAAQDLSLWIHETCNRVMQCWSCSHCTMSASGAVLKLIKTTCYMFYFSIFLYNPWPSGPILGISHGGALSYRLLLPRVKSTETDVCRVVMCYLNVYVDSNDQKINEKIFSKLVTKIMYHTYGLVQFLPVLVLFPCQLHR